MPLTKNVPANPPRDTSNEFQQRITTEWASDAVTLQCCQNRIHIYWHSFGKTIGKWGLKGTVCLIHSIHQMTLLWCWIRKIEYYNPSRMKATASSLMRHSIDNQFLTILSWRCWLVARSSWTSPLRAYLSTTRIFYSKFFWGTGRAGPKRMCIPT